MRPYEARCPADANINSNLPFVIVCLWSVGPLWSIHCNPATLNTGMAATAFGGRPKVQRQRHLQGEGVIKGLRVRGFGVYVKV